MTAETRVSVEQADEQAHAQEVELQEIADGAYGDGPKTRGAARDRLAALASSNRSEGEQSTVAFVQEWLMNADYDPSQFDRDFAAAIDARCAALVLIETDASGEAMVCTGCGTTRTVAAIRASSSTAFTCCPERKMIPVRDAIAPSAGVRDAGREAESDGETNGAFDPKAFGARVLSAMDGQSCRNTAAVIGISPATLNRVTRGNMPDVPTYVALLAWLDPQESFERSERQDWGDLHRLQQRGPCAVKPKLGGHIVRWAADEIAALRTCAAHGLGPHATVIEDEGPNGFMPVAVLRGSCAYIGQGRSQITMSLAVAERLSDALSAPSAGVRDAGRATLVAGPVWRETEEEDECWTAEIQTVGGYHIVATVHGATENETRDRQGLIHAALTARSDGEKQCDCAARFYGDDREAHQLCCASMPKHATPSPTTNAGGERENEPVGNSDELARLREALEVASGDLTCIRHALYNQRSGEATKLSSEALERVRQALATKGGAE